MTSCCRLFSLSDEILGLIIDMVCLWSNDHEWQTLSQVHRDLHMKKWVNVIRIQGRRWTSDLNRHISEFCDLRYIFISDPLASKMKPQMTISTQTLDIPSSFSLSILVVVFPIIIHMAPSLHHCLQILELRFVNPQFLEKLHLPQLSICKIEDFKHKHFDTISFGFAPNLHDLTLWGLHSLKSITNLSDNINTMDLACNKLKMHHLPTSLCKISLGGKIHSSIFHLLTQIRYLQKVTLYRSNYVTHISNLRDLTLLNLSLEMNDSDTTQQLIHANAHTLVTLYLRGGWSFAFPSVTFLKELNMHVDSVACLTTMAHCSMQNLIKLVIASHDQTPISIEWLNGHQFPKLAHLELFIWTSVSRLRTLQELKRLTFRMQDYYCRSDFFPMLEASNL